MRESGGYEGLRKSTVAVNSTTPVLLFATSPPTERAGYRVTNSAAATLYIAETPPGTTSISKADIVGGHYTAMLLPSEVFESSAGGGVPVFAVLASGTASLAVAELLA
jgi:hypothetical protein